MTINPIITAAEALALHGKSGTVFADATFHLPTAGRNALEEFNQERIDGAVFFNIDTIVAPDSDQPHTMPDAATFEVHMRGLGINKGDLVIVYDRSIFYSGARAWYMLRLFGHAEVRVLNGGFDAWRDAGGPVSTATPAPVAEGNFTASASLGDNAIILIDDMKSIIGMPDDQRSFQVIDARAAGRFKGEAAEPRPGLRAGHMPGAVNIPIGSLINPDNGYLKEKDELEAIFKGIDPAKPIITTCGSGVTACGLALGLNIIGVDGITVYDGSWSEWGSRADCPIATG